MNKERSKMLAQKMKEVFRSKSHHSDPIPKIPGNLECESKRTSNRGSFRQTAKHENSYRRSSLVNGRYGSPHFHANTPNDSSLGAQSRTNDVNRSDSLTQQLTTKPAISPHSEGKWHYSTSGLSCNSEASMRGSNKYNNFPDLGSGEAKITSQKRSAGTQNATLPEFNLNLNNERYCSPCKCNLAECRQHCLNGSRVYPNNNVIATNNNNYLFNSLPGKQGDSTLFSSVLKCAFGGEKSDRNDFIILGLGIHHYVKEVFNALDSANNGYILYEDLRILCKVLGKDLANLDNSTSCSSLDASDTKNSNLCGNNSCEIHLHFGNFSELICNIFGQDSDSNCLEKRKNTQLVNAVVNITRRNESLNGISRQLEELESEYMTITTNRDSQTVKDRGKYWRSKEQQNKNYHLHGNKNTSLENLKLQKIILLQQQELQCLREVIEDLRVSLQCSDAENLSLRVRSEKAADCNTLASLSQGRTTNRPVSSTSSAGSTDDGRDSIDRLILSFPSNDQLDMDLSESLSFGLSSRSTPERHLLSTPLTKPIGSDTQTSRESLMSTESTQNGSTTCYQHHHSTSSRVTPDTPMSTLRPKGRLHKQVEDDLSLENEIQLAYEKLSRTRMEVEDTRSDLETSVAQIRAQNCILDRLKQNLTEAEKRASDYSRENESLKEKIVFLQLEEENGSFKMESLVDDLTALKVHLGNRNEEVAHLSQEIDRLKTKRHRDLKQLSETRHIIASSLSKVKRNEDQLKTLLRPSRSPERTQNHRKLSSPGAPKDTSERALLAGKVSPHQLDKNNNKTGRRSLSPQVGECGGHTATAFIPFSNFGCSFSNNCNNSVIKGKNKLDYCQVNRAPRIICYEETEFSEDRDRSNASPYDVRRSEFDQKKMDSIQEQARGWKISTTENSDQRASSLNLSETVPDTPPLVATATDKVFTGPPPFRDKSTVLMLAPHSDDNKPTLEVKPNLIKPIAITIPLLKEEPINDPKYDPTSDPTAKPPMARGGEGKGEFVYREKGTQRVIGSQQNGGRFLYDEKTADKIYLSETPLSCPNDQSGYRTSTQILEGLEAEVEYMRKSLEEPIFS